LPDKLAVYILSYYGREDLRHLKAVQVICLICTQT